MKDNQISSQNIPDNMNKTINTISARLSLRMPQRHSLEILARITEIVPPSKNNNIENALEIINNEFSSVTDFERSFISLCFSLATGVGKTRLIGAFISYLYIEHGIKNFFVMAPNLTIYNKLITDLTPGTPKYVFKGISEFAITPPTIITGDTYNQLAGTLFDSLIECRINVFNISKINAEVRGGKAPKIKQLSEYIGQSYFDFLSGLPDLVMLMDESHRYRATAGLRAINELKPILGLELTATPYVETGKGPMHFKNIIYDYPLSRAMSDGFVKEPAVVTRKNFNPIGISNETLEEIKLIDGIALHENVKVELKTYAENTGRKLIKPFLLIIARDTTHAGQLLRKIQSEEFRNGEYREKVIQVDSSTKEEEVIERLLKVEETDEPTEIVIHVNMLKEGWDVTNLYTIVPLRAANARILIEQSIGRGLRLPYGKRTGESTVDTLNIVAHDKFQEILDEARRPDSPIHLKSLILDPDTLNDRVTTVISQANLENELNLTPSSSHQNTTSEKSVHAFTNSKDIEIAQLAYRTIFNLQNQPTIVPNTSYLKSPELQKSIVEQVIALKSPGQQDFEFVENTIKISEIVSKTVDLVIDNTINIPFILEIPKGDLQTSFYPFTLTFDNFHFTAISNDIWVQALRTGAVSLISQFGSFENEVRLEDLIVDTLSDYNDISYSDHAELLYDLAKQTVVHLKKSFPEDEILRILKIQNKSICFHIYQQMLAHSWDSSNEEFEVKISRGFSELKPSAYTVMANAGLLDFKMAPRDKNNIAKYLFNGFSRCLYHVQKFDSDQERILAIILDRDSQKWFRPSKGQFPIYYKKHGSFGQYEPDFVAETEKTIFMLESKNSDELSDPLVLAKKDSASRWCKHASDYSMETGGKPWSYLLIPHDHVSENKTISSLANEYKVYA
jgi:type III restriction enzyme